MSFEDAFDLIDRQIASLRGAMTIPGLALAVTTRDGLVGERAYGFADVAGRRPVDADTLFEIGSIGKTFTACCVMQLVEEGRLDLHAPVTTYLPWFSVRSAFDEPITVHHLLTHTSGLTRGSDITSDSLFEVWALRDTETCAPPGAFFWYSNVGYRVIGAVIEAVEGRPYPDVLRDRVLARVGMERSEPAITNAIFGRMAHGHGPWPDDRPAIPSDPMVPAVWFQTGTADGSVAATSSDLAEFLRMLMNRGEAGAGRVLSEASFELMAAKAAVVDDTEWYGYGLGRAVRGGIEYLGHGGSMVGFVSSMMADLDAGVGAVVLVNGMDWGDFTLDVARYAIGVMAAAVRGAPLPEPPAAPDLRHLEDAATYAGTYRADDGRTLELRADGERLTVVTPDGVATGAFPTPGTSSPRLVVRHPDLDLFPVTFERDGGGGVLAACNGPTLYSREGVTQPTEPEPDPSWQAFVGHYESSNPWTPHFRVVQRAGRLFFCERSGLEMPLAPLGPLGDATFGVADAALPERLRFDAIVDGKALRANLSGCDYYRAFTP